VAYNLLFKIIKKMKKPIYYILTYLFTILLFASCKKFVTIPAPKNQLVTSQIFADSLDANAAITGIYISIMGTDLDINSGGMTIVSGLSGDELYQTGNNTAYIQFYQNNIQLTNGANNEYWSDAYKYIYTANACIEGLKSSAGISRVKRDQFIAEVDFIRAFNYFYLVNMYGDVPLVTTTSLAVNAVLARTPKAQVYAQIISDLQYAEANLSSAAGNSTRPTSFAASALLAKVYLYNNQYDLAIAEASKVINSGSFNLVQDLNAVFLNSSSEIIWQMTPVEPGYASFEGHYFVPNSSVAVPKYVITPSLYNSFESGDKRKSQWVQSDTLNGTVYPYPYKFKESTVNGTPTEYEVVFRLADLYLIRSEAEVNQSNFDAAVKDLNVIRNRAGLPNFFSAEKTVVLTALKKERRSEFFCEWSNRWFDLKRWGDADNVLGLVKAQWKTTDQLYPIPSVQINTNSNLTQNPGY
jgi:hypothetical protein